jgi:HK97 family phage prohead protease
MKILQVSFDYKNPSLSRSKFRMLPFTYVQSLKKTYSFLWNAGISELADDAFEVWSQHEKGENVDFNKWIKQREKYGELHINDVNHLLREKITPRNSGTFISLLKWGIIPNFGIQKTKSLIADLIDSDWTMGKVKFEKTFNDYPSTAVENAKRALAQLDTKVGKRVNNVFASHVARKLSQGYKFTFNEIQKIASFIVHKKIANKSYDDDASAIVWDCLGGTNGIMWAKRRADSFKKMPELVEIEGYKKADCLSNETCNSCLFAKKGWCEQNNAPIIGDYVCKDWQDNEDKDNSTLIGLDSDARKRRKQLEERAINFNRATSAKANNLIASKRIGKEDGYEKSEYIQNYGWDEFAKWFVGQNTEYSKRSYNRYVYPITDNFVTLSQSAIKASKTKAGLRGHRQVLEELIRIESQVKHILRVEETDDSYIVEFGKTENQIQESEEERSVTEKEEKSFRFANKRKPTFKVIKDENGAVVDYQDVRIAGYGSTNEEITKADRGGDYLRKGAFKKTIKKFMNNPVMLADHANSTKTIVGKYTHVEEDEKGLYIEGELSNSPEQKNIRFQVAEGNLQTMSIGGIFKYEEDGKAIEEVDLMEISLVAIPMNPDARFIVKEASEENIEKI